MTFTFAKPLFFKKNLSHPQVINIVKDQYNVALKNIDLNTIRQKRTIIFSIFTVNYELKAEKGGNLGDKFVRAYNYVGLDLPKIYGKSVNLVHFDFCIHEIDSQDDEKCEIFYGAHLYYDASRPWLSLAVIGNLQRLCDTDIVFKREFLHTLGVKKIIFYSWATVKLTGLRTRTFFIK